MSKGPGRRKENFKAVQDRWPDMSKRGVANQRETKQAKKRKADKNNTASEEARVRCIKNGIDNFNKRNSYK